jgi:hypothetical protein
MVAKISLLRSSSSEDDSPSDSGESQPSAIVGTGWRKVLFKLVVDWLGVLPQVHANVFIFLTTLQILNLLQGFHSIHERKPSGSPSKIFPKRDAYWKEFAQNCHFGLKRLTKFM